MEMNFDHVRNNLADAIQTIANFTDIDLEPKKIPEKQVTQKQSNNINAEWEKMFLSQCNNKELLESCHPGFINQIKRKLGFTSDI